MAAWTRWLNFASTLQSRPLYSILAQRNRILQTGLPPSEGGKVIEALLGLSTVGMTKCSLHEFGCNRFASR